MTRLAIIGTGGMAKWQAQGFSKVKGCKIVAACDVDEARAKKFAAEHSIPAFYRDVDTMLAECEIDAVSVVAPDRFHAPLSLKAIAAGKHVLCEKPLAMNHAEALQMVRAAKRRGVINMVNLTYRSSAALQKAKELVESGVLGEIVHVDANYLQSWLASNIWGDWRSNPSMLWKLSVKHGSMGVLGDIGIHILDFASFPVGRITNVTSKLKAFSAVKGRKHGGYTLDANDSALIHVEFENGALGTIHTSRWATGYLNTLQLRLFGSKGALRIDLDYSVDKLEASLGKDMHAGKWREIKCQKVPTNYRRFIDAVNSGVQAQPDFQRGAEIQAILDACFVSHEALKPIDVAASRPRAQRKARTRIKS